MSAHVMIVEDEEPMLLVLSYNFRAAGYTVDAMPRGDAAAERLTSGIPDLLVLDWTLPGLSGVELCRRLRRRWPADALPIIMLTGHSDQADREYAFHVGVDEYLMKPFSVNDLLHTARRLLGRKSSKKVAEAMVAQAG